MQSNVKHIPFVLIFTRRVVFKWHPKSTTKDSLDFTVTHVVSSPSTAYNTGVCVAVPKNETGLCCATFSWRAYMPTEYRAQVDYVVETNADIYRQSHEFLFMLINLHFYCCVVYGRLHCTISISFKIVLILAELVSTWVQSLSCSLCMAGRRTVNQPLSFPCLDPGSIQACYVLVTI